MMVPSSNFACSSKLSRQVLGNKQMSLCPAMPLLGMLNAMRLMSTLAARPELNGCQGTVISDVGDGRWAVRLKTGKKVSVRGTHMVLAGVACSAVGPSRDASCDLLAQSLAAGVHHSAGLPSNIGPAPNCRHGGPDMGKGTTGLFLSAMLGFIGTCLEMQEQVEKSKFAQAELDIFFQYWSRPEMAETISESSYKVPFSCAVDSMVDSNFPMARHFLRTGFLVRMWAKHGGAAMLSAMKSTASGVAQSQEVQTFCRWLQETSTDRGTVLYLAQEIPCSCLSHLAATFEV